MLIPLTRKTFEELIPVVATGAQYTYYWGKLRDLLRRLLISVVGIFAVLIIRLIIGDGFNEFLLICGIVVGLYWLWGPVLWASLRNLECRKYSYCGFWQGRVLDFYVTEELIGTEETVNSRGDLVVVENRERCLNLEVGDETDFSTRLQVPLKRSHRAIDLGDIAEMLVFSHRGDLSRIAKTSDIYIPDHNLWVSDYPNLQRDAFIEVSRRLNARIQAESLDREQPRQRKRTPKNPSTKGALVRRDSDEGRYNERDSYARRDSDEPTDYADRDRPRRQSSRRRPKIEW
ncbi:MAG: phosphate ABC transporter permease [Leptolyngbyaceae cyanobacterium RU_5_1]|nr:phosphate ABC transporter permease [Leptolyngbyaceae cyanobacterium RU_5_1]